MDQEGDSAQPQEATNRKVRPVITPDAFSGEPMESWDDWLGHFESVAKVNGWDENTCLLWLEVRLTGKAHNAWRRLSNEARAQYSTAKAALRKRFEPDSRREVYVAEFHTRKRNPGERWEELADNMRLLADKAFPDLDDRAREQLSLDRYLTLLDKPEVALAVRQRRPRSVDEAVSCTLEVESYMRRFTNCSRQPITSVSESTAFDTETVHVGAVKANQDAILEMLRTLNTRLDQLERKVKSEEQPRYRQEKTGASSNGDYDGPIVCRKCKKEGHFARGCAAYRGVSRKPEN